MKIRFHDRSTATSWVKLMTDGILLAESQSDPWLNAYEAIIIDEAHERRLNIAFPPAAPERLADWGAELRSSAFSALY